MLNQKIHALGKEIQQHQRIQVELSQSNETLKQTLIKLQKALEAVQAEKMSGLEQKVTTEYLWCGRNVKVIDGSMVSMPDTLDNQKAYPQPSTQQGERI